MKMNSSVFFILCVVIISCSAQRSPYAGRGPIGYPSLTVTTSTADPLADRFGSDDTPSTTIRLPIEALGDVDLYNRLRKLPVDQQPFWLINWQALEEHRSKPQSYVPSRNSFIDTNDFDVKG